jgi:acetoacetyl-CoA synthetase
MTGKRLEIPIKRILLGMAPGDAVHPGAVDRPELLEVFAEYSKT